MQGEVYIAPGEADPQVVIIQNIHLERGARVYVFGNDSDFLVLGVKKLLSEVRMFRGCLTGHHIEADLVFKP
ncbi:unnamed protein product, partial [Scytosiphon promiscuus]